MRFVQSSEQLVIVGALYFLVLALPLAATYVIAGVGKAASNQLLLFCLSLLLLLSSGQVFFGVDFNLGFYLAVFTSYIYALIVFWRTKQEERRNGT